MTGQGLVSVIVPAYNAARTVRLAVESVLSQTYRHTEVVVVDDGSTDGTAIVAESIRDDRLSLIRHPRNLGPGAARNTAIRFASGRWIAFLDADDYWTENRLEVLVEAANSAGPNAFVADNLLFCFETPEGLRPWKPYLRRNQLVLLGRGCSDMTEFLEAGAPMIQPLIPADHVREWGLEFNTRWRMGEDLEFMMQLFATGLRLKLVTKPMYWYRLRPGSLTTREDRFLDLLKVYEHLLRVDGLSLEARAALARLYKRIQRQASFEPIRQAVRQRKYGVALRLLAKQPRLGVEVARRLPGAAAARLAAFVRQGVVR